MPKENTKKQSSLEKIQQNNKRFKEFYDLEIRNQSEGLDGAGKFENTSATNFFY